MKEVIIKELSEFYINYKPAIWMFIGWAAGLMPDYWLGNSKHKSLIGFLKFLNNKRHEKDVKPEEPNDKP